MMIFYLLSVVVYFVLPFSTSTVLLRYAFLLSSLFSGSLGGMYALREYGWQGAKSRTLLLLTLGITCWFIGEIIWTYFEYFVHENPFPSVADIFYIGAYPLLFVALFNEIRLSKVNWRSFSKSLIFLMVITAILFTIIVSYFGIFLAYSPKETMFTNIIAISYGIGDLVLIVSTLCLLVLAWEFRGGTLSQIWLTLFLSFLFMLGGDILFAIYTDAYNQTSSFTRSFVDFLWIISYMLFAYALLSFAFSIQSAHNYIQSLQKKKK